ncbi:MAG: cupin domain-containing protein [Acidimicrobiia bacterium]
MADTETESAAAALRPFIFDVSTIDGRTNAELMGGSPEGEAMLELLGRDLVTRPLVQTPQLCVYHETAKPGEQVKPHRHGVFQVDYVLRGELLFGNQRVGPGMGYFTPDMLYSWRAGEEGAEWIEIHSGVGGIYTDRPES